MFPLEFFYGVYFRSHAPFSGRFYHFQSKKCRDRPLPGPVNHFRFCKHCHMGSRVSSAPNTSRLGQPKRDISMFLNLSTPFPFYAV